MSELRIAGVSKRFGDSVALDAVDLTIDHGEVVVLLGPSGCGKTTLLRTIAGLASSDSGSITMGDVTLNSETVSVPPEKRSVGLVFQNGVLFPHLSVARNVGFGLPKAERKSSPRIDHLLDLVGLAGFGDRTPETLSGGQAQRVALARALAPQPDVLLMDEPFSNLDAVLRARLRHEIAEIVEHAQTTTLFVTHDREEAFALGDRIAVMDRGQIQQVGTPREVYEHPASRWVAEFVGDASFFEGVVSFGRFDSMFGTYETSLPNGDAVLMVRPDHLSLAGPLQSSAPARVTAVEYSGRSSLVHVEFDSNLGQGDATSAQVIVVGAPGVGVGETVNISATGGHVLPR